MFLSRESRDEIKLASSYFLFITEDVTELRRGSWVLHPALRLHKKPVDATPQKEKKAKAKRETDAAKSCSDIDGNDE